MTQVVFDTEQSLEAVYSAGQAMLAATRLEELPQTVVSSAMEALSADDASLLLLAPDQTLRLAYSSRIPRAEWESIRIPLGGSIAGRVAESRRPQIVDDEQRRNEDQPRRFRSSIVYPLCIGQRILGVLSLNRTDAERKSFVPDDLKRVKVFAASVELALENAELTRRMIYADRKRLLEHLAAGLAHEVNTPVQFASDSAGFLRGAFESFSRIQLRQRAVLQEAGIQPDICERLDDVAREEDLDFLLQNAPSAIHHLQDGLQRIAEIVAQVKRVARPELESTGSADAGAALRSAVELARSRIEQVAALNLDLNPVPVVRGDEKELTEAFLAILDNAVQAVKKAGASRHVFVALRVQGSEVLVSIRDTGPGIPPEIAAKIFDPFFTTSTVGEGRGMGLTIARNIVVDRCGGQLSFESEPGQGTTFFVKLDAIGGK